MVTKRRLCRGDRVADGGRRALPVLVLLLAYLLPLLVVPPTASVPLSDDWVYQPSVQHLVGAGELWIAPPTVVTLVLQVVWGTLFALPFGVTPVALRCSTLVASFAGTLACYGLCRALDVARPRALVGALAVWFAPLTFVLSYTFMSDVPYLALISLAANATVRAARREAFGGLAGGSLLAGAAFLVRQQGALIPLAALAWLLIARPAWYRAARCRARAATLGPCLVCVGGYYLWVATHGLPATQGSFIRSALGTGVGQALHQTWQLGIVGLFYVGLFVAPLVLGAARALPSAWRCAGGGPRTLTVGGLGILGLWTNWYALAHDGRPFPFIPFGSVINPEGLGTLADIDGHRGAVLPTWAWAAVALLCALAVAAAFVLVAGHERSDAAATDRARAFRGSPAGLVLALGLGQLAGAVPPALSIPTLIAYDRYYLPLLPFGVGVVLWALRGRRFSPGAAVLGLVLLASIDLVGVQDWLSFKQASWDAAQRLVVEQGVPLRQVEGGLEWDGAHFYEYALAHPDDRVPRRPGDPWWLDLFAPMIDPVYVVAASPAPPPGYQLLGRTRYHTWLRAGDDAWIYVWKRE